MLPIFTKSHQFVQFFPFLDNYWTRGTAIVVSENIKGWEKEKVGEIMARISSVIFLLSFKNHSHFPAILGGFHSAHGLG